MLEAETAPTYLSFLWWIIDPIITMAIFYTIFAIFLKIRTEDFAVFLILGLVIWQWFGNTVTSSSQSILQAGTLITRTNFPKLIFPFTVVLINTYKFLIVLGLVVVVLWLSGHPPNPLYLFLPVLLVLQLTLILAASTLVAAMIPLVPDLRYVVGSLVRAMMFVSAIFYPVTVVPEEYRTIFMLNPMATLIDAYRSVLMYGEWPDFGDLIYATAMIATLLFVAWYTFQKTEPHFARLMDEM